MLWSKAVRVLLILASIALFIPIALAHADHGLAETAVIRDSMASPGLSEDNLSDSIVIRVAGVPQAAEGTSYEGWLVSDDGSRKLSLGIIEIDVDGNSHHTFLSAPPPPPAAPVEGATAPPPPPGENLFAEFSTFVITIEPSGVVLSNHTIPAGAVVHIRHLVYSQTGNPAYTSGLHSGTEKGILVGLRQQTFDALTYTNLALASLKGGSLSEAQTHAKNTINIIEGSEGANYDPDAGYGGDEFGILNYAADAKHATFALGAAPDDPTLAKYQPHVVDSAANVANWAGAARDQAVRATKTSSTAVAELYLNNVARILDRALNGYDADGDGTIESIIGEGGAAQAYWGAQNMGSYSPAPPEGGIGAAPPKVGDPYVPTAAWAALMLGALLALGGTFIYRRGRVQA